MQESFLIVLALDTQMTVKPIREKSRISAYQLFIAGKYHAEIYPDHSENGRNLLVWRSHDPIDPYLVEIIGRAIENYDS